MFVPHRDPGLDPRVLPPILIILAASGLIAYRVLTPDWSWEWPGRAASGPAVASGKTETEKPVEVAKSVEAVKPAMPAGAKVATETKEAQPSPSVAAADALRAHLVEESANRLAPSPSVAAADALSDIQREADRVRKEREELKMLGELAAREDASRPRKLPPVPDRRPRIRPGDLALQMRQLQALLDPQMAFPGPLPDARDPNLRESARRRAQQMERAFRDLDRQNRELMRRAELEFRRQGLQMEQAFRDLDRIQAEMRRRAALGVPDLPAPPPGIFPGPAFGAFPGMGGFLPAPPGVDGGFQVQSGTRLGGG